MKALFFCPRCDEDFILDTERTQTTSCPECGVALRLEIDGGGDEPQYVLTPVVAPTCSICRRAHGNEVEHAAE